MSTSQPLVLPKFDHREILQLFLGQKYQAIAEKYLIILDYFDQRIYTKLPAPIKFYIDQFLIPNPRSRHEK